MATIKEIKEWLTSEKGMSREVLADLLGVGVGSVNNWLAGCNPIPAKRMKLIERLMLQKTIPAPEPPSMRPLAVSLSEAGFHKCLDAARREGFGERVDLWGGKMLEEAADHVLASIAAENSGS